PIEGGRFCRTSNRAARAFHGQTRFRHPLPPGKPRPLVTQSASVYNASPNMQCFSVCASMTGHAMQESTLAQAKQKGAAKTNRSLMDRLPRITFGPDKKKKKKKQQFEPQTPI